jgi:hypothetical protein
MKDTQIRVLTKEIALEGISQPLMLCKTEDGQPLNLTEGEETYLRGYDGNDVFVRVVEVMEEGKLAVLQILRREPNIQN